MSARGKMAGPNSDHLIHGETNKSYSNHPRLAITNTTCLYCQIHSRPTSEDFYVFMVEPKSLFMVRYMYIDLFSRGLKTDVNLFKHWILGALESGHHNLWSNDCNPDAWLPSLHRQWHHRLGFRHQRDNISAPSIHFGLKLNLMGFQLMVIHKQYKHQSYHMTTEETLLVIILQGNS